MDRPPLPPRSRTIGPGLAWLVALGLMAAPARGAGPDLERFEAEILPILEDRCYACHAYGMKKGNVALDADPDELLADRDLWWAVLRNVRAGVMPPPDADSRPTDEERARLDTWVRRDIHGFDPEDPDPGRVTLRRLNRVEYRNTIRDLVGIDFNTEEEFPPDDTGYGFDTIGDVLSVSPLLLEKYLQAAEAIVAEAVPTVSRVVRQRTVRGSEFRNPEGGRGDRLSLGEDAKIEHRFRVDLAGTYRLDVDLAVRGAFDFDPARAEVAFAVDGERRWGSELGWGAGKDAGFEVEVEWEPGEHTLALSVETKTDRAASKQPAGLRLSEVAVAGPLERSAWVHPPNYTRFFPRDEPPAEDQAEARRAYAREVLGPFASAAFRRPVEDRMLDRLVAIAEGHWSLPDKRFEEGVAHAMVAVLASPRFLFRVEGVEPAPKAGAHPYVDEYALAARLSYFLWSTMPDAELTALAARGELRANLEGQVRRMLADPRSDELIENFTGQWLQVRDIEGVPLDARAIQRREGRGRGDRVEFDRALRLDLKRETERSVEYVVREDRPVLELLDADYAFLNERLAKHYGVEGVEGDEIRKVDLPADSPRGGILTQGAILAVTSNPTRTSPVKRGLFLLENVLGTPPPPPPAEVPEFEEAEKAFEGRRPTTREVMELHRSQPLCNSCHARMDPLGLALENFNPLGMYRETEGRQPIDTAGVLISGEPFEGVRDLKKILATARRRDFYRCLAEKMLTYALGRGPEPADVETIEPIVERLDREGGRFSALLLGVVESAPFQKRRAGPAPTTAASATASATRTETRDDPEPRSQP